MDYLEGIVFIASRSELLRDKRVTVRMIANPAAGGFTQKKRAALNRRHLEEAIERTRTRPVVTRSCDGTIQYTESARHASELAAVIIAQTKKNAVSDDLVLVITAGGDGTSLEVQEEFAREILEEGNTSILERIVLVRLPFGTGNDGSDGRTLDETLKLFTEPARINLLSAIRVFSERDSARVWYSFNIASIGIDAFITHMTNRVKRFFPGDFYKIWVDLACLFYDRLYRVGKMSVVASTNSGDTVLTHSDEMLLYAMGVSGNRTYGSNQKILPDANNVCGLKNMSLLRKLSLKSFFKTGGHKGQPETMLYTADRLVVSYSEQILVQLDGESHVLLPADFPLVMERTRPFIPIITNA